MPFIAMPPVFVASAFIPSVFIPGMSAIASLPAGASGGEDAGIVIPGMSGFGVAGADCGAAGICIPGMLMPGIDIGWSCASAADGSASAASTDDHSKADERFRKVILR